MLHFLGKEIVSSGPRLGFAGSRKRVAPLPDSQAHTQRLASLSAKSLVGIGLSTAQPVVEMQGYKLGMPLGPVRPEQEKQGKGIRPTGKTDAPRAGGPVTLQPPHHGRMQSGPR